MSRRPLFFIIAIFAVSLVLTSCTGPFTGHSDTVSSEKAMLRIVLSDGSTARGAAYTKDDVTSFRVTILSADRNSAVIPAETVTPDADGTCTYEKEIDPGTYSVYVQAIISGSANWTAYKAPSFYGITENQQVVASDTPTTISVNMVPLTISGSTTKSVDSADWDKGIIPQAVPASSTHMYFWDSTGSARQLAARLPATTNGTGFTLYADDASLLFYMSDEGEDPLLDENHHIINGVGFSPDKPMKATDNAIEAIYHYSDENRDTQIVINLLGDISSADLYFCYPLTINGNGHTIKADVDYDFMSCVVGFYDDGKNEDGYSGTYFITNTTFDGALTFNGEDPVYDLYVRGIDSTASLVLDHCTIQNCSQSPDSYTENNHTYWNNVYGAGIYNKGALTMTDCTIKNCYIDQEGECSGGYGSGIAVITDEDSENPSAATLTRCTFENCKSCGFGGGLYISKNGSEVILKDCSFTKCKAGDEGNGGGIYMKGTLSLQGNNTFSYCSAGSSGGGLYLDTPTGTFESGSLCTFNYCTASINGGGLATTCFGGFSNCTFNNCSATYGGGAYSQGIGSQLFTNTIAEITDCAFNNCTATSGGAWSSSLNNESLSYTINKCTITECSSENGGGLAYKGSLTLSNSTITGCTAEQSGGGLYGNNESNSTRTVTISGCTISECHQGSSAGNGGGIYNYDAQLTITNTNISNCIDYNGNNNMIFCIGEHASLTINGTSSTIGADGILIENQISASGT